jgi:hypothetical protein
MQNILQLASVKLLSNKSNYCGVIEKAQCGCAAVLLAVSFLHRYL